MWVNISFPILFSCHLLCWWIVKFWLCKAVMSRWTQHLKAKNTRGAGGSCGCSSSQVSPQIFKQLLQKCILAADLLETWKGWRKGLLMALLCSELSARERAVSRERQQTQSLPGGGLLKVIWTERPPSFPISEDTLRCVFTRKLSILMSRGCSCSYNNVLPQSIKIIYSFPE